MPLIMMCGYPCSGKSKRVEELSEHLKGRGTPCIVVSEQSLYPDTADAYANSNNEKKLRGMLRSEVERVLTQDTVVIVDSLNYIKGFRYELFCVARSLKTTHCVVQTLTHQEACLKTHEEHDRPYGTQEQLQQIMNRMEEPNSHQRWDKPTYAVAPDEELPCDEIVEYLFSGNIKVKPHEATQSQPLSATNFLYEVDRITQQVVAAVVSAQQRAVAGDKLAIPNTDAFVIVQAKKYTMSDLRRLRQAFMNYCKGHPGTTAAAAATLFVNFINSSARSQFSATA